MRLGRGWTHGQRAHRMRDHLPPQMCLLRGCEVHHVQAGSIQPCCQTLVTPCRANRGPHLCQSRAHKSGMPHTGTFLCPKSH